MNFIKFLKGYEILKSNFSVNLITLSNLMHYQAIKFNF